jgi:hypothetical protein
MKTKTLIAVAIALAFVATPTMVTADHETEDRESTYISMSRVQHGLGGPFNQFCEEQITGGEDCPAFIPSGLMSVACDHAAGWSSVNEPQPNPGNLPEGSPISGGDTLVATPFKGVGGTSFCNVLRGATITVEVDDALSPLQSASVNCPFEDLTQVTVNRALDYPDPSEADPEYTGTIPDWCASNPADAQATGTTTTCDHRILGMGFLNCAPDHEYDEDDGPYNYCDPSLSEPGQTVHGESVYCGHPGWQDNTRITVFVNGPPLGLATMGEVTLEF